MKYTIIIPIFNSENTLSICLDSIINQTYNNIEIILVDDGSTDSSFSLCKNYKNKDKRIKLLHNKINKGVGFSRNKGLINVTGDYFTFVDSDDFIPLDYIEKINELNTDNYDLIRVGIIQNGINLYKDMPLGVFNNDKIIVKYLLNHDYYAGASIINRKFKDVKFKEDIYIFEDKLYFTELLNLVSNILLSNKTYYNYCFNINGITHNDSYKLKYESSIKAYSYSKELLLKYKADFYLDYSLFVDQVLYFFYNYVKFLKYKEFLLLLDGLCNNIEFIKLINTSCNINFAKRLIIYFLNHRFYIGVFVFYKLKKLAHI